MHTQMNIINSYRKFCQSVSVAFGRIMMAISVPLVLAARYLSVFLSYIGFKRYRKYNPWSVKILTWGGLRGGLALAMALSIPSGILVIPEKLIDVKEIIMVMTYSVVVFSILIQGSTITPMIEKAKQAEREMEAEGSVEPQEAKVLRYQIHITCTCYA